MQPPSDLPIDSGTSLLSLTTPEIHGDYRHLLRPGMAIERALATAGISGHELHMGSYRSSDGGEACLWDLYQNHRSMKGILGVLSLASNSIVHEVRYKGGLSLKTGQVLSQLRWSPGGFVRKTTAFAYAHEIACGYTWHGAVPPAVPTTVSGKALRKDYERWNGLLAMFKDGGFCDRSDPPARDSATESERHAAALSQNFVLGLKTYVQRLKGKQLRPRRPSRIT
ncbi:hypothetical protein C8R46DRAFT_1024627 [Mycena filopes]|nr:hypothetical protein C8R46DRAFT_1024627 [Mycena filopes]